MRRLTFDTERIMRFVSYRLNWPGEWGWALGAGVERDGDLIGGVVLSHYTPGIDIYLACAGDRGWLGRDIIRVAFEFPFLSLGVPRVTALGAVSSRKSSALLLGLGFQVEGRMRRAAPGGDDLMVYGMLREECRWIGGRNGKEIGK
jgi:RimJ/RimL family protein N-acetyltransferase